MAVKKGDNIKVHYIGTFDDGEEFDNSEKNGWPLEFEVGSGMVVEGFDEAVIGMNVGEEKNTIIPPQKAYGLRDESLVKTFPRSQLKIPVTENQEILVGVSGGKQIPARIMKLTEEIVTIDMNHSLAGKTLHFFIRLVEIE